MIFFVDFGLNLIYNVLLIILENHLSVDSGRYIRGCSPLPSFLKISITFEMMYM